MISLMLSQMFDIFDKENNDLNVSRIKFCLLRKQFTEQNNENISK